jgi:hypothetical protein
LRRVMRVRYMRWWRFVYFFMPDHNNMDW